MDLCIHNFLNIQIFFGGGNHSFLDFSRTSGLRMNITFVFKRESPGLFFCASHKCFIAKSLLQGFSPFHSERYLLLPLLQQCTSRLTPGEYLTPPRSPSCSRQVPNSTAAVTYLLSSTLFDHPHAGAAC